MNDVYSFLVGVMITFILIINIHLLDEKTKYKDDDRNLSIKYNIIFYIFNILCYLFLNKIREKRKIDYYKYFIKCFDDNIIYFKLSYDPKISLEIAIKKRNEIIRYLKLKKLKNK